MPASEPGPGPAKAPFDPLLVCWPRRLSYNAPARQASRLGPVAHRVRTRFFNTRAPPEAIRLSAKPPHQSSITPHAGLWEVRASPAATPPIHCGGPRRAPQSFVRETLRRHAQGPPSPQLHQHGGPVPLDVRAQPLPCEVGRRGDGDALHRLFWGGGER
eukprot:gene4959-biopygen9614